MKGKRKFRNVIAKILEDFNVRVTLGDCFFYDPDTCTVYFTPFSSSSDEFHRHWILQNFNYTIKEREYFLFSLLHEVGHHYTFSDLTDEDLQYEIFCRKILENFDKYRTADEINEAYFNLPAEKLATQWAIDFMSEYPHWCRKMNRKIYQAFNKLENINQWILY